MNTYVFTYYGWIPGYNDFDQDWITIKASTLETAKAELQKLNLYAKHAPILESINGVRVPSGGPGN